MVITLLVIAGYYMDSVEAVIQAVYRQLVINIMCCITDTVRLTKPRLETALDPHFYVNYVHKKTGFNTSSKYNL